MLGCGVSLHPGRDAEAPFEIMRLYLEAGGRADKAIMSHVDREFERNTLQEFTIFNSHLFFYCS